jgi:hypothetical protein
VCEHANAGAHMRGQAVSGRAGPECRLASAQKIGRRWAREGERASAWEGAVRTLG